MRERFLCKNTRKTVRESSCKNAFTCRKFSALVSLTLSLSLAFSSRVFENSPLSFYIFAHSHWDVFFPALRSALFSCYLCEFIV